MGERLIAEQWCPVCTPLNWCGCNTNPRRRSATAADIVAHLQARPKLKLATGWACSREDRWSRWALSGGDIVRVMPAMPRWFWYVLGADSSGMGECDTLEDARAAADAALVAALVAAGWALAGGDRG